MEIHDGSGRMLASLSFDLPNWDAEANANRIVACVNACAGIPMSEEAMMIVAMSSIASRVKDLEKVVIAFGMMTQGHSVPQEAKEEAVAVFKSLVE
jgi:mannose/fructose/N-acetylgalactosamine-specific phosphotransferase system component IIB